MASEHVHWNGALQYRHMKFKADTATRFIAGIEKQDTKLSMCDTLDALLDITEDANAVVTGLKTQKTSNEPKPLVLDDVAIASIVQAIAEHQATHLWTLPAG